MAGTPAIPIVTALVGNEPIKLLLPTGNEAFTTPDQIGAKAAGQAPVQSVNGQTGDVELTGADITGVVETTGAQSIDGVKTFSSNPIVPVPSDGPEVANKNYVDAQITVVDQGKVSVTSTPNSIYGTDGAGAARIYPTNAVDGVVVADGTGKIPTALLPPAQHDSAEANSEAAMLALANVSAPAICIRTDFTPAHVFYLHTDPPSTLANWTDTGEFGGGAADPSATVGLTAKNGIATSYMRSDGAPALDQAIAPTWTGAHTFEQTLAVLPAGGNGIAVAGTNASGVPSIAAEGAAADISLEIKAKGSAGIALGSSTTVAGGLAVAGEVSAAQGAGSASPTNSGIALATAPNWSMAQFYDAARSANDRSMDILFISDGLHMRFVNDARNAFLDFLAVTGGQGSGVTGITSTSGSGSWTHTGSHTVLQPNDVYKVWVAKSTASDTQNAPTAIGAASTYLQIGGREWKVNGFGGIGFGYVTGNTVNPPVWIGWEEKVTSSFTNGDFLIATRPTNTNVAPTERFRITAAGDATFTNPVKTGGYTVATLPAASAALQGARAFVTDAAASPAFLAAVTGGGTTVAPVFCNGTAWVYG